MFLITRFAFFKSSERTKSTFLKSFVFLMENKLSPIIFATAKAVVAFTNRQY